MSPMQTIVNRNLIRYAVQTAMFCKSCESVLDMRRAVCFTPVEKETGEVHKSFTVCADCWSKRGAAITSNAEMLGCTVEVLDGRELWGKR